MSRHECKIFPGAVVCEESFLRGDITIGTGCVIHPKASIIAESGPIILGDHCMLEEYASLIYNVVNTETPSKPAIIGSGNIFEVGCAVSTSGLGDNNVFESKCVVPKEVKVGNNCVIGAGCKLEGPQHLPDNTVVFGKKCHMRESVEKPPSQNQQLDFLIKVLPNYHRLRRPNVDTKKTIPRI